MSPLRDRGPGSVRSVGEPRYGAVDSHARRWARVRRLLTRDLCPGQEAVRWSGAARQKRLVGGRCVGAVAACGSSTSTSPPETTTPVTTSAPVEARQIWSRRWIEEIESFVRSDKPGPPATARIYAYTAASYADAMSASDGAGPQANEVTRQVLRALLPKHAAEIDTFAATLAAPVTLAKPLQDLAAQYVARIPIDGAAADNPDAAMATEPAGDGHWVRVGGAGPANPSAGTWMRWILPAGTTFTVPPPPEYGTKAYEDEMRIVADYARRRDVVWQAKILRWRARAGHQRTVRDLARPLLDGQRAELQN